MTSGPNSPWDWPGIVERLIALVGAGEGSTGIAQILNKEYRVKLTRNAVIGKRDRLKLRGPAREPRKAKVETQRVQARMIQNRIPRPPRMITEDRIWSDVASSRPFLERKSSQCAWPVGDNRSCCAPIDRGSYCVEHSSIAYTSTGSEKELVRQLRRFL